MEDLTACATLKRIRQQKGWNRWKLALNTRIRFCSKITEDKIAAFENGEKRPADTLRNRLATVLGHQEKEVFPEYLIACKTLRSHRLQRGLTLREVSEAANKRFGRKMPYNELCAYENGLRYCHRRTREQLAAIFETTEEKLFPEYSNLRADREPSRPS